MKKIKNILIIILSLFFISCASTNKKELGKIKKEEEITSRSTAIRFLPEYYKAGKTITVKIVVSPAKKTPGIIVEEKVPERWEIIRSTPQYMKRQKNTYKYLFYGKEVLPFEITYTVKIPEGENGEKEFRGVIKTFREKNIQIGGDNKIRNKP